MSARNIDTNGWIEIKRNPISCVGVFPYSGRVIDPDGKMGLDPGKFYNVYRSAEELSRPETLESFRLLPWTDDHPKQMLGVAPDLMPAEDKGIHGVIGENIYFDGEYLRANIKVLSKELADLIDSGKKELSIGYWALYKPERGEYNGQKYDFIQTDLLGNHISSVDEGRSGKEVSVLDDKKFGGELSMKEDNRPDGEIVKAHDDEQQGGLTLGSLHTALNQFKEEVKAMFQKLTRMETAEDVEESEAEAKDGDTQREDGDSSRDTKDKAKDNMSYDKTKDIKAKDEDDEEKKEMPKHEAMDAAEFRKSVIKEVAERDKLAKKVSDFIGSFDAAEMTADEVAQYSIKKLGLKCKRGEERAVLMGYLAAAQVNKPVATADGLIDASIKKSSVSSQFDAYLSQGRGQ